MDILELMKERHSVRQYKNQAIELAKREAINALINDVNAKSKLSIQAFYDEPKCFNSFMAHYGKFEKAWYPFANERTKGCENTGWGRKSRRRPMG